MKKTIAVLMALMLTVSAAAGCGSTGASTGTGSADAGAATQEAAETDAGAEGQDETDAAGQEEADAAGQEEKGAAGQEDAQAVSDAGIADGMYQADFNTDSSMFHVNEAKDGKGILVVNEGKMTIHIVMPSKNIVNLFCGTAEDAQKEGAELLEPLTEEVMYSDGTKEEVNTFDVPVPYLDEAFDLALIGTKCLQSGLPR